MENKKFTKDDLKVGYAVRVRSGDLYMFMPTGYSERTLVGERGFLGVDKYYNTDLSHVLTSPSTGLAEPSWTEFDIMEIYGLCDWPAESLRLDTAHRKLLWKREEARKMTVEEIEKELGYKIEIVS